MERRGVGHAAAGSRPSLWRLWRFYDGLFGGLRIGDRNEQQLVDALAVHVDDFDLPRTELERIAFGGNARQALERQACRGVEIAVLLLQSEFLRQIPDRGASVDQP